MVGEIGVSAIGKEVAVSGTLGVTSASGLQAPTKSRQKMITKNPKSFWRSIDTPPKWK
jgi:hypothetical protein